MKKLLLFTLSMLYMTAFGKTLKKSFYYSQYNNQKITYGVVYPDGYDSSKYYPVLYAEGGVGEKTWEQSTEANWDVMINKPGQAIYEYNVSPKTYPMVVIQALWPYSPGEPTITELKTTQRRYGALMKELIIVTSKRIKLDPSRLYISGLSEGGGDVWECLTQWGNTVAACVAMSCWNPSPGSTPYTSYKDSDLAKCGAVVLQVSGDNDPVIGGTQGALNMAYYIGQMKKLGMNCDIVVSQEDGHGSWVPIFQNRIFAAYDSYNGVTCAKQPTDIFAWLLSKKRADVTAPKDTTIAAPPVVVPPTAAKDTFNGDGLKQMFYTIQKVDTIGGNWGMGSPMKAIPIDNFFLKYAGYLRVPKSGNYTFYLGSDDGGRLIINDIECINNYSDHSFNEKQVILFLEAGVKHTLVVEYYEGYVDSRLQLLWDKGEGKKQSLKRYTYSK